MLNELNEWFESQVSPKFPIRVWHLVSLTIFSVILLIIVVCCLKDCRIPRTRQEIERKRKQNQHRSTFVRYLRQIQNIDLPFEQILDLIKEQEKRARKQSTEQCLSSKLTILQRLKLFARGKRQNTAPGIELSFDIEDFNEQFQEKEDLVEQEIKKASDQIDSHSLKIEISEP